MADNTAILNSFSTMWQVLEENAKTSPNQPAVREKAFGIWQTWSWRDYSENARQLALGLIDLGMEDSSPVAIVGNNRQQLYSAMFSVQMAGGIPIPIYQDAVADEMLHVLQHSESKIIIAEDQEQVDKVIELGEKLPKVEKIIYLEEKSMRSYESEDIISIKSVLSRGENVPDQCHKELESRKSKQTSETTGVILYTSGTTGKSKGVVLSNANILTAASGAIEFDSLKPGMEIVSYLPMAWVGDFIFSTCMAPLGKMCINCPESRDTVRSDIPEIGPHYFFGPPRVFEGLLTSIMIRIEDASSIKRRLFHYFMGLAKRVGGDVLEGKSVGVFNRVLYGLGDLIIDGPLRNSLGMSRVRVGYTAGEAIGPEIFEFFRSIGINLKQLYGQTEAGVFVTMQPDGEVRSGTVGVPAPGVELKIGDGGEVYYRSPSSFIEYYKNAKSTSDTKDKDGWVATGDAGFIEEGTGHLKIIDRAKDVGKMSSGEMFAPKYVENKLKFYPNILEAVLFGKDRKKCVAFINIDLSSVGNWAEKENIAYSSYQELAAHPQVYDMIEEHINEVNVDVSKDKMLSDCQIDRFLILHKELDPDDGEITRTRKVRRQFVEEKYSDLVKALYDGSKNIKTETKVTYEDGREGSISANLEIRNAKLAS